MKIYIGADHAGFNMKEKLKVYLIDQGHEVDDKGAFSFDQDDDYPDFVFPVAEAVAGEAESRGIVVGGSGFGESMCANRVKGIRSLVFYGPMAPKEAVDISGRESDDPYEIVRISRMHNDSNMLSLGMRFITEDQVLETIRIFLATPFSEDERHTRRIQKLDK